MIISQRSHELISPGWHQARFDSHEDLGTPAWSAGGKPIVRLKFTTDQTGSSGQLLSADLLCSATLGRGSKLRSVVEAINNGTVPQQLDLSDLHGKECLVLIAHRSKEGNTFNNVSQILPAKPVAATTAPAASLLNDPQFAKQLFPNQKPALGRPETFVLASQEL